MRRSGLQQFLGMGADGPTRADGVARVLQVVLVTAGALTGTWLVITLLSAAHG